MTADNPRMHYKIGEISRKLNISVETIRMYEREGILLTNKTSQGQRVFNNDDLKWIRCIRRLIKDEGLNLEGIRRLLALMPCWKLRPCQLEELEDCPAFHGDLRPCWTMKPEIPESCRGKNCRCCNVYTSATQCENLKDIIYHRD